MTRPIDSDSLKRQAIFWGLALAVFLLFFMTFRSILLPFVAGMALAYFLDPVADWLERRGLSRMMATVVILIAFIVVFVLALVLLIPVLVTQASEFGNRLPGYVSQLQGSIASSGGSRVPAWLNNQIAVIKANSSKYLGDVASFLPTLFAQIWDSGKALVDIMSLFVITPVVAFYLLLDWDRMIDRVDSWIPRDNVEVIRGLASQIDAAISGFVRGQGSLCLILALYYGTGLSLAGLNFGLLIGLFTGAISFIPYVGSTVGLLLSFGVALVQFWPDYTHVALVLAIFFSGQFIEGNILQPKLVGESVGLHPVWLMFALMAFGALFGFVGLLVAVPCAAVVGVLVRFAIGRYLDSNLYHGHSASSAPTRTKTEE